jgi:hypothetical protein
MSIRRRRLGEVRKADALELEDATYQTAVLHVYDWQHRGVRHFYTELFELMSRADDGNMLRLALAFPYHALAYQGWRTARTEREFFEAAGYLVSRFN